MAEKNKYLALAQTTKTESKRLQKDATAILNEKPRYDTARLDFYCNLVRSRAKLKLEDCGQDPSCRKYMQKRIATVDMEIKLFEDSFPGVVNFKVRCK